MTHYKYKGKKASIDYEIDYGLSLDYKEALNLLHPDIKWCHVEIGSYQGNLISLGIDKNGEWYYKMNSYGSCSGCDWVQSINTETEAIDFFKKQESLDHIYKNNLEVYLKNELNNVYDFEEKHLEEFLKFIKENTK
jgi:hypothetical protein